MISDTQDVTISFEYTRVLSNIALEEVIVFKEYSVDRNGEMKHVSECLTDQWSNARDRRSKRRSPVKLALLK